MTITDFTRKANISAGKAAFHNGEDLKVEEAKIGNIDCQIAFRQGFFMAQCGANRILPASATVKPVNGALKFDGGKAPVMQGAIGRFPLAIEQVALVSKYGKDKYGTYDGWEKVEDAFNRYDDAFGRHTLLHRSEGSYDIGDSGLPHLAQRAWNALATLELALRNGTIEMTTGNEIKDGKPVLGSNGRSNGA